MRLQPCRPHEGGTLKPAISAPYIARRADRRFGAACLSGAALGVALVGGGQPGWSSLPFLSWKLSLRLVLGEAKLPFCKSHPDELRRTSAPPLPSAGMPLQRVVGPEFRRRHLTTSPAHSGSIALRVDRERQGDEGAPPRRLEAPRGRWESSQWPRRCSLTEESELHQEVDGRWMEGNEEAERDLGCRGSAVVPDDGDGFAVCLKGSSNKDDGCSSGAWMELAIFRSCFRCARAAL